MALDVLEARHVGAPAVEARIAASTGALAARRERAWRLYTELPHPDSTRDEDWRRTDVSRLDPQTFIADPGPTDHGDALVAHLRALRDRIAPDAAFIASTRNGIRACLDTDLLTAQGVILGDLEELTVSHPEVVERGLSAVAAVSDRDTYGGARFLALWHALWRGGTLVYVPPGVEARVPVVAAHSAAGERPAIFPATVAVLGQNSSLTLIELLASPEQGGEVFSDAVSALVVGDGARLDHCVLQQWGSGAWHVALHRATLGRDARLRSFYATLGSRLQKAYIEAELREPGAEAQLAGVVFGGGDQHLDHQSLQVHAAPRTVSDLLLKVAVRDRARSVYGGLVLVEEGAAGANGYVQNRNLMLSRGARATGIPRLEIRTDDVRCSHGVTAGHVDDEQRFYLQSRGVPAAEADRLIVRGFMQDALDRCPHPGFAATVGELLDEALEGRSLAGIAVAPAGPTAQGPT
ncbi:MAG TPA: Fe-S cluster assembly protein SufD [Candidatus Dormibacteraeota bacterium]